MPCTGTYEHGTFWKSVIEVSGVSLITGDDYIKILNYKYQTIILPG